MNLNPGSWIFVCMVLCRVADLFIDLDPAFQVNPDLDSGKGFGDQKIEKIQLKKIIFFAGKLQFTCPLASINDVKLQEMPSALKREHPALKKKLNLLFFSIF
jgi:hypothetical protein